MKPSPSIISFMDWAFDAVSKRPLHSHSNLAFSLWDLNYITFLSSLHFLILKTVVIPHNIVRLTEITCLKFPVRTLYTVDTQQILMLLPFVSFTILFLVNIKKKVLNWTVSLHSIIIIELQVNSVNGLQRPDQKETAWNSVSTLAVQAVPRLRRTHRLLNETCLTLAKLAAASGDLWELCHTMQWLLCHR